MDLGSNCHDCDYGDLNAIWRHLQSTPCRDPSLALVKPRLVPVRFSRSKASKLRVTLRDLSIQRMAIGFSKQSAPNVWVDGTWDSGDGRRCRTQKWSRSSHCAELEHNSVRIGVFLSFLPVLHLSAFTGMTVTQPSSRHRERVTSTK